MPRRVRASSRPQRRGSLRRPLAREPFLCVRLTLACVQGDAVGIKVNKLSSTKTQLPYEYYSLPFCKPPKIVNSAENLGEARLHSAALRARLHTPLTPPCALLGAARRPHREQRLRGACASRAHTPRPAHATHRPSPVLRVQLSMRVDTFCAATCMLGPLTPEVSKQFEVKIEDEYRVNMILDNLPVGMVRMKEDARGMVKTYERGYPVGFKLTGEDGNARFYVNNHLRFTILYHEDLDASLARIVGFEVEPFSVRHRRSSNRGEWDPSDPALRTCEPERGMDALGRDEPPQEVAPGETVYFTHDFVYRASDIRWASRWDTYLLMTDTQIHWFSIVNSLVIVLFLSGMVALIMMRTLHADIAAYNAPSGDAPDAADAAEESGWKLVHGDVLRPPAAYGALAVYVGSGVQVLCMTVITMFFALLGFLSPANRGALMTAMLLLFSFCGVAGGYVSARLYKGLFRGAGWRLHTLRTALTFPGVAFSVFCVLNTLIWGQRSSGAVPFGTLFVLFFLWFGISVPLVFVGSYFGSKVEPPADPVRTNKIPRQVPEQPWYMSAPVTVLVGGILPFGAVFIELFFILTSMWLHQFYYVFGFLLIVLLILAVTCAEIAVVLVYFQLCAEDYNWWWRAFFTPGSSALYLFGYATFYFFTKLDITKGVSAALYFGYMFLFSYAFFVVTGTVGFLASLWFVRSIYASVKID